MKTNLLLTLFTIACHFYGQAQFTFQRTYGTTIDDYGSSVTQTFDGGYIIGTPYNGLNGVIKTDAHGDTLWQKTYPFLNNMPNYASVNSIIQTSDSNYVLVGSLPDNDSYILKINNVGDTLWFKRSGHGIYPVWYAKVIEDNSGNLVIVGSEEFSSSNCCAPIMVKTDSNGNIIPSFSPNITCPYPTGCRLVTVFIDSDGNYLVSGDTPSPNLPHPRLTKVGVNGNVLWSMYYTLTDASVSGITQTQDNGYLLVGADWTFGDSTLVYKTDNNGNLQWLKRYKGNTTSWQGKSIDKTNGGYFISGSNQNIFLMKIDLNYNLLWSYEFGGSLEEICGQMKSTTDDGCIIVGSTKSYGAGANDVYFIKTDQNGIAVGQNEINLPKHTFTILPNPFASQTTLRTDKALANATLTLYNALGQQVKQVNNINGQTLTLNRDNLSSGLYYLQLLQDNQTIATDKLVITD
jgi:hypothetical protein